MALSIRPCYPSIENGISFGSAVFLSEYQTMNKEQKSMKYQVYYTLPD